MTLLHYFTDLPGWWAFLLTLLGVPAAFEVGYRVGVVRHRHAHDEKADPVGQLGVTTLGMLGFFLAFTFAFAATRYEYKRQLVVQEANAIGTTWLRTDFLDDAARSKARTLLREYVALRLGEDRYEPAVLQRVGAIQNELWALAAARMNENPQSVRAGLLVQTLNDSIDLQGERMIAAVHMRIPVGIFLALDLMTLLAMLAMGYHAALTETRRSPAVMLLALTFASVMWLVAELDRGYQGLLAVSHEPLIQLQKSIGPPDPGG